MRCTTPIALYTKLDDDYKKTSDVFLSIVDSTWRRLTCRDKNVLSPTEFVKSSKVEYSFFVDNLIYLKHRINRISRGKQ